MTQTEAQSAWEAFKAAKADPTKTNGEIVTLHNKLYEKQRVLKLAGDSQKQLAEKDAEIARLKALVDGKGKATGKAV